MKTLDKKQEFMNTLKNKPYDKDIDRHMGEGIEQGALLIVKILILAFLIIATVLITGYLCKNGTEFNTCL